MSSEIATLPQVLESPPSSLPGELLPGPLLPPQVVPVRRAALGGLFFLHCVGAPLRNPDPPKRGQLAGRSATRPGELPSPTPLSKR